MCPRVSFTFWGAGLSSQPIPRVVGGLLEKHKGMVLSMGLSDAEFCITVLAAFSLALPLYRVCLFSLGVLGGAEHKIVLGHVLVPFLGFH